MKNKNGFTLIELLGVIVILSIIITLVVVGILKIVENAKESAYEQQLSHLRDAVVTYAVANDIVLKKCEYNNPDEIRENCDLRPIVIDDLIPDFFKDSADKCFKYYDERELEKSVIYIYTDASYGFGVIAPKNICKKQTDDMDEAFVFTE